MSDEQKNISRRNFLQGAKGWSAAVVGLLLVAETGTPAEASEVTFGGGGWLNSRGGGGGGWLNNRGGGGWLNNRGGGGGGGWLNNRGGGGGWLNNRGGGGWLNRR